MRSIKLIFLTYDSSALRLIDPTFFASESLSWVDSSKKKFQFTLFGQKFFFVLQLLAINVDSHYGSNNATTRDVSRSFV